MRRVRTAVLASTALASIVALGGCSQNDTVSRTIMIGNAQGVLTTADLRTITERPLPYRGRPIVCTEPPPDVAKALSTAFAANAQGSAPSGAGGSGAISNATAESLAELSGRVPGLVALRDTLFRACEAYANGIIGDDVYGLVTSRYGELLVTLLLAENIQARPTAATLNGVVLTAPSTQGDGPTQKPAQSGSPKQTSISNAPRDTVLLAADQVTESTTGHSDHRERVQLASLVPMVTAAATEPSGGAATTPSIGAGTSGAAGTGADKGTGTDKGAGTGAGANGQKNTGTQNTTQPKGTPATGTGTDSSGTAAALAKMQENYLTIGLLQPLIVACINEYDPTRSAYYEQQGSLPRPNPMLSPELCKSALSTGINGQKLQTWVAAQAALKQAGVTKSIAIPSIAQ